MTWTPGPTEPQSATTKSESFNLIDTGVRFGNRRLFIEGDDKRDALVLKFQAWAMRQI